MKKFTILALGLVALAALPASAAIWSDTSLGYRTSNQFTSDGFEGTHKKDIYSLTHVSGYSLGTNFFAVDMLKSDAGDPENNVALAKGSSARGAQEVFVTYNTTLSLGALNKTKITFGPVTDVGILGGFNFGAKNEAFASSTFAYLLGPTFSFKVPGFLNVGLQYYKESNHNAFAGFSSSPDAANNVVFKGTYELNANWGINAALGSVNTQITGFLCYTGAKGKNGSGVDTKAETLLNAFWMFDASPVCGASKGTWQIGPGFEYWDNRFGDPTASTNASALSISPNAVANPRTSALMAKVEFHF